MSTTRWINRGFATIIRSRTIRLVLDLFDANCALGMVSRPSPAGAFLTADSLIEHQAGFGISRALVYHSLALEEHATVGNELLIDAVKDFNELIPSWIALPHHTGEFPKPEAFVADLRAAHVPAVRIMPDQHNYLVDDWMMDDLFAALAGNTPLFWHIEKLDTLTARDLYRVSGDHPSLQIVVCDVDKSINRTITPLMRARPNLWIETGGYRTHRGIEFLSTAVGSDHLVFGSKLPWQAVGPPHAELVYADIDTNTRQAIATENLNRLLEMESG